MIYTERLQKQWFWENPFSQILVDSRRKDRRVNTPTITCDCSSNCSLKIFFMDVAISALFSDYSVCVTIEK